MKLRIRSLKTKETSRIEVPGDSSVQQLKELICSKLPAASPLSPDKLFLSLNRKDELLSVSDSLQSVGIAPGDLLYYSVKIPDSEAASSSQPMDEQLDEAVKLSASHDKPRAKSAKGVNEQPMELRAGEGKGKMVDSHAADEGLLTETLKNEGFENSVEGCQETEGSYAEEGDEEMLVDEKSSFSVPSFLRKVFENEAGGGTSSGNNDHKLMVIAVHAALLESGFVGYDPVLKKRVDGFNFPDQWPFRALYYSTPEALSLEKEEEGVETILLKFQGLGKFLNVIGSSSKEAFLYRICLDGSRFTPALNFLWWNGDSTDEKYVSMEEKLRVEKEVFELWKTVKDGLALPLLIDLCENAGLESPPCFSQLPTEIKLSILHMLPGADVAKVACTCSELRFLASNDDLWKQKFSEEFGLDTASLYPVGWKAKFISSWVNRKKVEMVRPMRFRHRFPMCPVRTEPILPFAQPFPNYGPVWGGGAGSDGEYRLPQMLGFPSQRRGRLYNPLCNNVGRRY